MKRSRRVQLVLLGGLSAGALTGCDVSSPRKAVSTEGVYTNNYFVPGAGYYHAPFQAWYARPYNDYDPQTKRYYYGGQWGPAPHQSITNISSPTLLAVQQVNPPIVSRGGFGRTSHHHGVWS